MVAKAFDDPLPAYPEYERKVLRKVRARAPPKSMERNDG